MYAHLPIFPGSPGVQPAYRTSQRPGTHSLRPHAGHLARRQTRRLQLPRRHLGRRDHRRHGPARHHAPGPRHRSRSSAPTAEDRLQFQPPRQLRRFRRARPGRPADPPDLRLGDGHGQRLVARRQEHPVRLDAQHRLSARATSCTRSRSRAAWRGASAPPRARKASSRRRAIASPTSAGPAPGIARAIAARPTTTSGSATPTAATTGK